MRKNRLFPLAGGLTAFLLLSWILADGSGGLLAEKETPLKITGVVNATPFSIGGEIMIRLNGSPLTNAIVSLGNHRFSERKPGLYFGDLRKSVTIGTAVVLKIRRQAFARSLAGADDYIGRGVITNTLKMIYPGASETIWLSNTPQLTFRWAFAGATEKSCLMIDGGGYHYTHCQTELQHAVATNQMPRKVSLRWEMQNFFPDLVFNRPLAPGSKVGLYMATGGNFLTL
jgi:hypothetical protein